MGVSTDGHICFGLLFEEGYEFPWDKDEHDGCQDDWWFIIRGGDAACPVKHDQIWDANDNWKGGKKTPELEALWKERHSFKKQWFEDNPLPIELVNVCHAEYPIWILALPGTVMTVWRGDPQPFMPEHLPEKINPEAMERFTQFVKEFGLEPVDLEPKWYLGSYWG